MYFSRPRFMLKMSFRHHSNQIICIIWYSSIRLHVVNPSIKNKDWTLCFAYACSGLQQRECQRSCLQLGEELVASQQESERLQEELQQVITQLDTYIRSEPVHQVAYKRIFTLLYQTGLATHPTTVAGTVLERKFQSAQFGLFVHNSVKRESIYIYRIYRAPCTFV